MRKEPSDKKNWLLTVASCAAGLLILGIWQFALKGNSSGGGQLFYAGAFDPQIVGQNGDSGPLFNGRVPSLSWIVGSDCRRGMQAYLQSSSTNPDAALVGTGWVDPTTGLLIAGKSNICTPNSLSMDAVVKVVHQHGGKAYLTIAMETDGSATSWTTAQQTAYVVKASQTPGYIDPIVREVERAGYDGVIMDLEGTDNTYPGIQQSFAAYNQQVWHALQPLHKPYGIALIHKVSDNDAYNSLNGFENWSLLAKSADFLVVMAVDQSYETPGPPVSVAWLQQLLAYTLRTMPQMLSRVIWELPLYGDSWHQTNGNWIFDGIVAYQDAMKIVNSTSSSQVDTAQSNVQDPYQPHFVYTDSSGVTHALWFMNAQALHAIMQDFQTLLRKQSPVVGDSFQFAVWWRTTAEPPDFWQQVDMLY